MVYGVNSTFVGTNLDASWLTNSTQTLQTSLENNPVAHLATTSLICAAASKVATNSLVRLGFFLNCQVALNAALLGPSFFQAIAVEPQSKTLENTAEVIYNNIAVGPLNATRDAATWAVDKAHQFSTYMMTSNFAVGVPLSTIYSMFKATKIATTGTVVKTSINGLAHRFGLAPMWAAIGTNAFFTIPAMIRDFFGTPDSKEGSAFAQTVGNLANAWTKTGHMIVDLTNYLVDGAQSILKRMQA